LELQAHTRVLVVDDEPTIRDLVAEALSEAGFEIGTASNGVEALTVMQNWVPEVIVLDLMMPRLDGTGFTELMRLDPRYAEVPVLLLTAAYNGAQAAVQMGACSWLSKPFELDHLVREVAALVGRHEPSRRLDVLGPAARNGAISHPEA